VFPRSFDLSRLPAAALLIVVLMGGAMAIAPGGRAVSSVPLPPPGGNEAPPAPVDRTVDIRFQDIMAGIVWMDGHPNLRLTREQARQMLPDVRKMADHLEHLWQLQVRMNAQFRADQWKYIHDHRWDELAHLDLPVPEPYARMSDPLKTIRFAREIARQEATKDLPASPALRYVPAADDGISWFHLSQGTVLFQARYPQLAITPDEARALAPLFDELERLMVDVEQYEHTLVGMFTDAQRKWILDQKSGRAVETVNGRPILDGGQQPPTARVVSVVEARAR
jgi:hypothetical protein